MHYKCQCTVCGTGASFQGFLLQHQNYAALSVGAKLEVMEAISASHPVTQASSPPRQDALRTRNAMTSFENVQDLVFFLHVLLEAPAAALLTTLTGSA